ncbi:hypothetical protein [Polynucleobacter yangtzensis]|uniref:hypothetical protein n=1 Tax=Polynucleobacter yangtzensis TaxID=1743159 RepID=UPI0012377E0E|nr:hypothetical protein [Polynucleobacter yangtzensis]
MNIIVIGGYFFEYPNLGLNHSISYAVILHILLFVLYLAGYRLHRNYANSNNLIIQTTSYQITEPSFFHQSVLLVLLLCGIFSSVYTVSYVVNTEEYLMSLMSGEIIVRGVEVASVDGGAPGFLKMATYMPLAIFGIYVIAIRQNFKLKKLNLLIFITSIFAIIFKVLFTIDRLSIIYLIIGTLMIKNKFSNSTKLLIKIFLFIIFIIFISVTALRIDRYDDGFFGALFLYSRLGLENLQLLIDNESPLTLGSQTLFNPIFFILDRISFFPQPIKNYDYIWNPAQYFYGHLYMDYGIMTLPIVFLYGALGSYIEIRSSIPANRIANAFLLPMATNNFTGIGVVWLRGVEFYFVVLLIMMFKFSGISIKRLDVGKLNKHENVD